MQSGQGDGKHLFVVIRPASRVEQAHPKLLPPHRGEHAVLLRSVRADADETRTVVLRDVTDDGPDALMATGLPVIVSVSMKSLADLKIRQRWAALLNPRTSTVLIDLSLTRHLRSWLTEPEARARYGLARYSVVERESVVLGVQVITPSGTSRLFVAVISPSFAAAFEVWLVGSTDVSDRVERDDTLLDEQHPLVSTTVGHLIVEEPFFNFQAGGPE
jgi:hypothetical protein